MPIQYTPYICQNIQHINKYTEGVHAVLLEARAGGAVRTRPSQGARGQRLGALGAGGADQHAAALRQDDLGLDVRGGNDVGRAERRDQHLQHVQAHLAEAAAQLRQVLLRGVQAGPGGGGLQGGPPEHGGDRAARPQRRARRARGTLVPEQGGRRGPQKSASTPKVCLCAARRAAGARRPAAPHACCAACVMRAARRARVSVLRVPGPEHAQDTARRRQLGLHEELDGEEHDERGVHLGDDDAHACVYLGERDVRPGRRAETATRPGLDYHKHEETQRQLQAV